MKEWRKQSGPKFSITLKWTVITSIFIFALFTILAIAVYTTSTNLLVKREHQKLKSTMQQVEVRLTYLRKPLTNQNTVEQLKRNSRYESGQKEHETFETSIMRLNSLISDLAQPELNVYIYNPNKKIVFKTHELTLPYKPNLSDNIKIVTFDNMSGFLAKKPLYSQETHHLIGYVQMFYKLDSFYAIRQQLFFTLVILDLIAVFVSFFLGYGLANYFLNPLKQMTAAINKIKAEPQADIRLPEVQSKDELSYLASAFNDMLDRMQCFIEQQQQFVEDVSHELRTPVAIIEGHLKLLDRWGKEDPVVLAESLQASLQEISRMKTLVQEMLDLTRIEQVRFHPTNECTEAKEVIEQTYNNFRILYPDFTFILDDTIKEDTEIQIFRNHFEQLLIILLDNAVKYSTDRKEIHLSVAATQNELEIAIQDYGEGIAEEDLDKVFNRFYRVDKARSRHKGGNGLGLSIAQELVEGYHGRIGVESSLGKGTIFHIFLPLVKK